jgi:hypothetical protein
MSHLIDDVADYLASNGVGTVATDIFVGFLPEEPNNCVAVLDTGGSTPDAYIPTKSATFQVLVRSENYDVGKTKLNTIRELLHRKTNSNLGTGSNYLFYILAMSEGGHIGREENGLDTFSINFQTLSYDNESL